MATPQPEEAEKDACLKYDMGPVFLYGLIAQFVIVGVMLVDLLCRHGQFIHRTIKM